MSSVSIVVLTYGRTVYFVLYHFKKVNRTNSNRLLLLLKSTIENPSQSVSRNFFQFISTPDYSFESCCKVYLNVWTFVTIAISKLLFVQIPREWGLPSKMSVYLRMPHTEDGSNGVNRPNNYTFALFVCYKLSAICVRCAHFVQRNFIIKQ